MLYKKNFLQKLSCRSASVKSSKIELENQKMRTKIFLELLLLKEKISFKTYASEFCFKKISLLSKRTQKTVEILIAVRENSVQKMKHLLKYKLQRLMRKRF